MPMDKEALQEKRCILAQSFKKEFGENSHDGTPGETFP